MLRQLPAKLKFEKEFSMKKRLPYILCFLVLLGTELIIGTFVRDTFIRPYVGDMLVAMLLCSLAKIVFPRAGWKLTASVFAFSTAVELVQLLNLPQRLGFEGSALSVAMGSVFDWADLVCYLIGCVLFRLADTMFKQKKGML